MSVKDKIRETLGLGPKPESDEPAQTKLPSDYFEQHREEMAAAGEAKAIEALANDDDIPDDAPGDEQIDAMEAAANKLDTLDLPEGAWGLIDRAMDGLGRNTGAGLEDADAKLEAKQRAALVKAADNNLSVVLQALTVATPVLDRPGVVYSMLYKVLGQAVFFANLDYQQAQAMDLYSEDAVVEEFFNRYVSSTYVEEALARVVEDRVLDADSTGRQQEEAEDHTHAIGFETRREAQIEALKAAYGSDDPAEAVVQALNDLQMFFQLTCESFGWDPTNPMPFANVRNPNGTYTPISDARTALDAQEIKRQAARAKRREARAVQMTAAQEAAAKILAKSLERPTVHRRK